MPDWIAITTPKTMEGLGAADPEVTFQVNEVSPIERQVARKSIKNFNTAVTGKVPSPDGFPTWNVNLAFSRFDAVSGFFLLPRSSPSKQYEVKVARLPGKWTPQFTLLDALPLPRFDPFKKVLAVSKKVDMKEGPRVGDLGKKDDELADGAQALAKAALLNFFAVLSDEQDPIGEVPWFSYVREIVRMDRERFLVEVDPILFESVQTILIKLSSTYKEQGYFTESPALHYANIPARYHSDRNLREIITVKKKYEQGNVQLTVSYLNTPRCVVHLLDCDMDEHANIVEHGFDIIKHLINGGTSPIAMHDYIVRDSAQKAGGVATIDLGYKLV